MIGDLKPHEAYKDSGQDWLGAIPAHWSLHRAKRLFREVDERSKTGKEELLSVSHLTGVTPRRLKTVTMFMAESNVGHKVCRPGDLVINTLWAWMAALGVTRHTGLVSPAYGVYRPIDGSGILPAYADHLLRTPMYAAEYQRRSTGVNSSRLRLYPEQFLRVPVLMPPIDEQALIVRFLVWANGRIDHAMRRKRKVVALLTEQRLAVVHRALTGGYAQLGETFATGDRWFPLLPKDWRALTLRRVITSAIDGPHFSPTYRDTGIPFLSARNVKVDRWNLDDAKFISKKDYVEFSKRVQPAIGDVLFTKGGTTGVARVVDLSFPFQVWVHIAVLKVKTDLIDPNYLAICLNSHRCYEQSQLYTRGATNQDLGLGRMKDIVLPVPRDLAVQRELMASLQKEVAPLAAEIMTTQREIELLREYRSRLVADVVTGRLDVCGAANRLPLEIAPEEHEEPIDEVDDVELASEEAEA